MNVNVKKEFRVNDCTDPAKAVFALHQIATLLWDAVSNKQEFSVSIEIGSEQYGKADGWALFRPDGSSEVQIKVEAPKKAESK